MRWLLVLLVAGGFLMVVFIAAVAVLGSNLQTTFDEVSAHMSKPDEAPAR